MLVRLLVDEFNVDSGPLKTVGSLQLDSDGYIVVGLLLATWGTARAVWKLGRFEQRRDGLRRVSVPPVGCTRRGRSFRHLLPSDNSPE